MRELHVVALSEDGRSVLLATSKKAVTGGFRVALDARLAAAVRGDLPRPGEEVVRDSTLTPKDIQARLRAGETPEKIANEAGVPVARVERFAGPVSSERLRIIDQVQSGRLTRGRRGPSALPLGAAVDLHLAATGSLRPESVGWSTRREEEGTWIVELRYVARARQRIATWRYDPSAKSVAAVDAGSAALGHVEEAEAAHQRAVRASRRATASTARPAKPAKKAPARGSSARGKPASKTPAKKAAAKRAPAKQAPAKRAPAKQAPTKQAPTKQAPTKQAPTKRAPVKKAPVKKVPVKKASTSQAPRRKAAAPRLRVVPPTEVTPRPLPAKRDPDGVRSRASVPGWADVLLGTAPRAERGADD